MQDFVSGQDRFDWTIAFFYEMESPAENRDRHLFIVQSQLVKNRGVQVAAIVRILNRAVADLVCPAMHDTALYSASGKPNRVPARIVVPSRRILRPGRPAEIA